MTLERCSDRGLDKVSGAWRRNYLVGREVESVTESFPEEGRLSFIWKCNGRLPDDFYRRVLN